MSFAGATADFDPSDGPFLVIDIGGGSTECMVGTDEPDDVRSFDVGLRAAHREAPHQRPAGARGAEQRHRRGERLVRGPVAGGPQRPRGQDGDRPGRHHLHDRRGRARDGRVRPRPRSTTSSSPASAIEDVFRTLATERLADRIHNPGLEEARADVIVGGLCVLVAFVRTLGIDELLVSESDILDGLVASLDLGSRSMDGTWHPPADAWATTRVGRFGTEHGFDDLDVAARPVDRGSRAWFWDAVVQHLGIPFATPYEQVLDDSDGIPWARWFTGGRTNLADACCRPLGRGHARRRGDRVGGRGGRDPHVDLRASSAPRPTGCRGCSSSAASPPATPSASTCRCSRRRPPPCWRSPSSAPSSCRCSPATAPRPCACASRTPSAKALITADAFPRRGKPVPMLATALEAAGATPTIVVVDRLGTDVDLRRPGAPVAAAGQRRLRDARGRQRAHPLPRLHVGHDRPAQGRRSTSTAAGR